MYGGGPFASSVSTRSVLPSSRAQASVSRVEDLVGRGLAHHLPDADVGAVQLGVLLHGEDAEGGAPGLADQVDLLLVEPVAQVVGDRDRVGDGPVQGHRVGWVELVVGLPGAPLVEGDDHEVVLECLAVAPHRAELAAAGSAGQEQQHRVLGAAPADHQREVMPADLHPGQLRDAAGDRLAVRVDDRVGGRRASDETSQGHERQPAGKPATARRKPTPTECSARCARPFGGRPAPRQGRTQSGSQHHRQQRQQPVDAAADRERHDPVGACPGGCRPPSVPRRRAGPARRPATKVTGATSIAHRVRTGARRPPDQQSKTYRGQGLERTRRPTGRPLRGKLAVGRRHRDDENPRDPSVSEQPFKERLE